MVLLKCSNFCGKNSLPLDAAQPICRAGYLKTTMSSSLPEALSTVGHNIYRFQAGSGVELDLLEEVH